MGYSISVKFKSKQDLEEMQKFLNDNLDIINKIKNFDFYGKLESDFYISEDVPYAPKVDNLLGYKGTVIPMYLYSIFAWISIKAECKDKDGNYIYYDDEKLKITTDINNKKDIIVDKDGIRIYQEKEESIFSFFKNNNENNKKQKLLLIDLDNKWNQLKLNKINKKGLKNE